jgi:hypothetical protein
MSTLVDVNRHLTVEDFERIFDTYSAKYLFKQWERCNKIEGVFRLCLDNNDLLAWDRARNKN